MSTPPIPLAEFQRLSGLSDSAIVWLLIHNKIPLAYSPATGISVDAGHPTTADLVAAITHQHEAGLEADAPLIRERMRTLINTHLESILESALERINSTPEKSA
ncbi:MAG: hypothetical protein RL417_2511 [Pseudomonadota bacterium]|jgi:hypothetical protein